MPAGEHATCLASRVGHVPWRGRECGRLRVAVKDGRGVVGDGCAVSGKHRADSEGSREVEQRAREIARGMYETRFVETRYRMSHVLRDDRSVVKTD